MFFIDYRKNKVFLYESKEISDYLNINTNIENVAISNRIAGIFNLEKSSLFKSNFNEKVEHRKFQELYVVILQELI